MYAVTWHVWRQLLQRFGSAEFQCVLPPHNWSGMLRSRLERRLLGRKGDFFPFAASVLTETSRRVRTAISRDTESLLFRSSTRWIRCRPEVPYFVHTDACFHTYCGNKDAAQQYRLSDLQRIWDEEAAFFEAAAAVFFESEWAMEKARSVYGLRGKHYYAVGVAGGLPVPRTIAGNDKVVRLVSVANHFRQKGGDLTFAAFKLLHARYPHLRWHIVGGRPDFGVTQHPGVIYEGFINLDSTADMNRYCSLLNEASLLVHPTREDMNPLVLMEAAGFGCPAVSVADFAIPELVIDGQTGLLLPRPVSAESLAAAIEELILDDSRYQSMRQAARLRANKVFSWDRVGQALCDVISSNLGAGG